MLAVLRGTFVAYAAVPPAPPRGGRKHAPLCSHSYGPRRAALPDACFTRRWAARCLLRPGVADRPPSACALWRCILRLWELRRCAALPIDKALRIGPTSHDVGQIPGALQVVNPARPRLLPGVVKPALGACADSTDPLRDLRESTMCLPVPAGTAETCCACMRLEEPEGRGALRCGRAAGGFGTQDSAC